eukprot:maker-scaffold50_size457468-snap-gene-1.13 protein:Tk03204 transcript:maker-scaffold50_size457468-snap-gene-1.13-mRNA-1 annotation:"chitooligosaccharidolytic beta-n-acetylglucosaminidase"
MVPSGTDNYFIRTRSNVISQACKMGFKFILVLSLFGSLENVRGFSRNSDPIELVHWRWQCVNNKECIRGHPDDIDESQSSDPWLSLEGCKSLCGFHGSLWPQPEHVNLGQRLVPIQFDPVSSFFVDDIKSKQVLQALQGSWDIFYTHAQNLVRHHSSHKLTSTSSKSCNVHFQIARESLQLELYTPEDYELELKSSPDGVSVHIRATTFFGARHALETLSQMVTFDPLERTLQIVNSASIQDKPKFPYRGLLLDTGRNYFSVDAIRKIMDGMSYDKLNVLHWHMNEQQSFPFVSESVPHLTKYGAYGKDKLYYKEDVQGIVEYGRQRGIIVLPEFDAPAHASFGWEWGPKERMGNLVVCQKEEWADRERNLAAEPPSGQLNPVNPNVYEILEKLYGDMLEAFALPNQTVSMFHMGGDEVNFPCWAMDKDILGWLRDRRLDTNPDVNPEGFLKLWSFFQDKAKKRLVQANGGHEFKNNIIIWTSELAKPDVIERFLPSRDYVIQVWCESTDVWISQLLDKGYRLIFSNSDAWYLDCGFGAWVFSGQGHDNNWCSPFKSWKIFYENSPRNLVVNMGLEWDESVKKLVWGGEAAMWSEQVDEYGVESRIWPRLSAMAERLWSDPTTPWQYAEARMLEHRSRLVERGIKADAIQPEFCRQHQGWCFMPRKNMFNSDPFDPQMIEAELKGRDLSMEESLRLADIQRLSGVRKEPLVHQNSNSIGFLLIVSVILLVFYLNRRALLGTFVVLWRCLREKVV